MSLIQLENISKSYGKQQILAGVSLKINDGDRLGLVGRNGSGKTTLVNIIAGQVFDFEGKLYKAKHAEIAYFRQDAQLDSDTTLRQEMLKVFRDLRGIEDEILLICEKLDTQPDNRNLIDELSLLQLKHEQLGGYDYEYQVEKTLSGLGFTELEFNLQVGRLSGGQKSRALLGKFLLQKPDLLLLDEPTNHLDINTIQWLENFIETEFKGAVLTISHDRYFLDQVSGKVIELRSCQIKEYRGNYTSYLKTKGIADISQQRLYDKQQQHIAHQEEFIQRNIAGQRSREAKGRQKKLDRLERVEKPTSELPAMKIDFVTEARGGNDILECLNLGIDFGEKTIFTGINAEVSRQDVVGLIGPNGVGKTTFFRLILGDIEPTVGKLRLGRNLKIGYYDQEMKGLASSNTLISEINELKPDWSQEELRNYLGRFLFLHDDVFKVIAHLSAGEKARLIFSKLLLEQPNLLLLDEPTNHLDIPSIEALEVALNEYSGTILVISHDRHFLNKIANKFLVFANSRATLFPGTYAEYKAHLENHQRSETSTSIKGKKKGKTKNRGGNDTSKERVLIATESKKTKRKKRKVPQSILS
ncbi:multidrug ABC transporter ATP-binding protein [Candidatus Poribacteria bacterium]|nr:multidrug ABC transporter ATP-binding protein [Candidatus Poribacteria bacterium]